jgi:hypothetical protein
MGRGLSLDNARFGVVWFVDAFLRIWSERLREIW